MQSGLKYNLFYKNYGQGSDTTLGPKEDVAKAEKLLNQSFAENWQDVNKPRSEPVKITNSAKLSSRIIQIYRDLNPIWLVLCGFGVLIILVGSLFQRHS